MKCVICKKGDTAPGHATVTLERAGTIAVIRNVPADICQDCGEYYLSEETSKRVMDQAEDQAEAAATRRAEVEVAPFAA